MRLCCLFSVLVSQIREKGGAYGASAGQTNGVFYMFSYYDPHTSRTLKAFREACEWAAAGKFTDQV